METKIVLDEREQPWMAVRVCATCQPESSPRTPFGLNSRCRHCGGDGEVEWRFTPQIRPAALMSSPQHPQPGRTPQR